MAEDKKLPMADDANAMISAVVDAVTKLLDVLPENTPPNAVVTGLVLVASSIAAACGEKEDSFTEGCRQVYHLALAGKDRAEV